MKNYGTVAVFLQHNPMSNLSDIKAGTGLSGASVFYALGVLKRKGVLHVDRDRFKTHGHFCRYSYDPKALPQNFKTYRTLVLECLSNGESMTAAEIAERTGVHKPAVQCALFALRKAGKAKSTLQPSKRYHSGVNLWRLS